MIIYDHLYNIWYNLNESCVNETLRRELQSKIKPSIIDLFDEFVEFLDLVKRDTNVEAVADYNRFKIYLLYDKANIVSEKGKLMKH